MRNEDLIKLKEKINQLSAEEKRLRDLYLRNLATGAIQGPPVGYASIDKPWLKLYEAEYIGKKLPEKTIYRYALDNMKSDFSLTAIRFLSFKISFAEFFEKVDKVANSFTALGIKEGDTVTICSPTFPETIYANFALNKIGAIANNIDPRNNASRIADSINATSSDYLVMLDVVYPKIDSIINKTKLKKVICNSYLDSVPSFLKPLYKAIISKELKNKGLRFPKIASNDRYISWSDFIKLGKNTQAQEVIYSKDRPAAMVMTGGTTGFPKSVVLTNETALSLVESYLATDLRLEKGQSLLNIMPEFIAYGWTFGVVMATCLGIENIVIPQFEIDKFPEYIIKNKPNHIVGVPTHCDYLINDKRMQNVDFSEFLVSISVGGDHYCEESEKNFNAFLHNHGYDKNVIVGYGMTEGNSSLSTRLNKCNLLGSVGIPLVKNTISVFDIEEESMATDIELPYDSIGEICISGPSIMKEYYMNPKETAKNLVLHSDGTVWLHSKDSGYIEPSGVIHIMGRKKRMIVRPDGHNVWPSEMEKIITSHPAVESCCVVGIPSKNDLQGEYPHAIVILKNNQEINYNEAKVEQELRQLCSMNLPERDVPYTYSFRPNLLLTGIGKIDFIKMKEEIIDGQKKVKKRIKEKR